MLGRRGSSRCWRCLGMGRGKRRSRRVWEKLDMNDDYNISADDHFDVEREVDRTYKDSEPTIMAKSLFARIPLMTPKTTVISSDFLCKGGNILAPFRFDTLSPDDIVSFGKNSSRSGSKVSHMGFRRSPPPYRSLTNNRNRQILRGRIGANFASAGTGILDSTGTAISMTKQIQDFTTLRSNIISRIGIGATNSILSKSIFLISSGGNDVFAFFAQNTSPNSTETEKFIATLISNYKRHLKNLYDLGARKLAIVDVAPIGCCPYSRSQHPLGLCLDVLNSLALGVNNASKVLFQELSSSLQGMKYSIGSSYAVVSSIIADPQAVGYKEVKSACCGSGNLNAASGCTPNATYCEDRGHYLFWDRIHPTHATSKRAGVALYGGSLEFASPINFKQLVEDKS